MMKKINVVTLLGIALLVLSSGIWMGCGENQSRITQPSQNNDPMALPLPELQQASLLETICKRGESVPHGHVIVGQGRLPRSRCPQGPFPFNGWVVKRPFVQESVCNNSPVPSGFRVISYQARGTQCPNYSTSGWNMKVIKAY